jgi:hypothetical protein
MRVITNRRLVEFALLHADAGIPLQAVLTHSQYDEGKWK